MSSYFFLVISSFWILKPIKKTLFVEFYSQRGFELFGMAFDAAQALGEREHLRRRGERVGGLDAAGQMTGVSHALHVGDGQ